MVVIVALALALALGIQAWLVKPYQIPSESMEPTLDVGQRVLVNRFLYHFKDPAPGDIVVFHPPAGADNGTECGTTVNGRQPTEIGMSCPQPTAQYGQTDWTTRSAFRVRAARWELGSDRAALPRPSGSPLNCFRTGQRRIRLPTCTARPTSVGLRGAHRIDAPGRFEDHDKSADAGPSSGRAAAPMSGRLKSANPSRL